MYFPGIITASVTDITGAGIAACSSVFTHWDPTVDVVNPIFSDLNVPSLAANSPAKNKGATTLVGSGKIPGYYTITGATNDVLNADLGAYPTDGSGNKHMPSSAQGAK